MKVYVSHYDVSGESVIVSVETTNGTLDDVIREIRDSEWFTLSRTKADEPEIRIASEKGVCLAKVYLYSDLVYFFPYFFFHADLGRTALKPVKKWCICSPTHTVHKVCKNKWEAKRVCFEWNSLPCPMYGGDLSIEQVRFYA